jgi:hypothetical protein
VGTVPDVSYPVEMITGGQPVGDTFGRAAAFLNLAAARALPITLTGAHAGR